MRLAKIIFIGFCLVLSIGLIFLNVGICQQTKPEASGTQQPAVSPEGKAPAPTGACPTPAKAPEQVKPESKPAVPAKPPEKQPGKAESQEGC
jgi:hypothetical protein